jgi:hypothetical protein
VVTVKPVICATRRHRSYEISYFPTFELTAKIENVIRQRLGWAARLEGSKMSYSEQAFAEAIGRKILDSKGSRLVELLYFLEEEKTLELLRSFSALGRSEQTKILQLLKAASNRRPAKGRTVIGVQPGG